ncbi:MAG: N-6 DNA methylase, partial [Syntrophus sp. (in: bacteria)]
PTLGSLINPNRMGKEDMFTAGYDDLVPLLGMALAEEKDDYEADEIGVAAQGLAKAAHLLSGKYDLVVTNVPYLSRGKQCNKLKDFCETWHGWGKNDLANVFLERCLEFNTAGGVTQIVMPQNWLFLTTYKKQREHLLKHETWNLLARLGPKGFRTPLWDFNVQLLTLTHANANDGHLLRGLDASVPRKPEEKEAQLRIAEIKQVEQNKQLENPDAVIVFQNVVHESLLSKVATSNYGSKPGQTDRVIRYHWEVSELTDKWQPLESTPSGASLFTGKEKICLSLQEVEKQGINEFGIRSADIWGKCGIVQSQMSEMPYSIYLGRIFDNNTSVIHSLNSEYLPAILVFFESGEYLEEIRKLNQKLDVAAHTMTKVPFDLAHCQKVAAEKYPNGLPKPYSDDPAQWIFHGHPGPATAPLQVAIVRLLGYRWPVETDERMELSDEARSWVKKAKALSIGHLVDDNGIVCIPPVRGEKPAAERLLNLLAAAYGEAWSPSTLSKLLADADCNGKTLEVWLRDKFFEQHFKLFHHRPFIWHIWDGVKDGFAALVNYHKLTRQNLETLIYSYIGDWIKRQEDEIKQGVDGAGIRLAAARKLKTELEKILEGEGDEEKGYDIFIRWKPLEQQPIGWDPDLNDGVRLNIRPFMQAGILRKNPNINWNKDRGKDVASSPWYKLGLNYGGKEGDRINDHHLSLAEKKAARTAKAEM